MWADMQGTEILLPLEAVYGDAPARPRAVFVLTDGRVRPIPSRAGRGACDGGRPARWTTRRR
jgi:hypothetical protein